MASYNRLVLVGNLGRDAELRATPGGKQVLTCSIAVEDWQKKDDKGKAETEWFRVKVWGKQAESLSSYLTKGKTILVDGHLSIQTWKDKEGRARYTPEVSADRVVLLGGKRDEDAPTTARARPVADPFDDSPGDGNDDIPF